MLTSWWRRLAVCLLAVGVFAESAPLPLVQAVGDSIMLQARFEQVRHLVPFSVPVKSSGTLLIAVDFGVLIFEFDHPNKDGWAATSKSIWHWLENSPEPKVLEDTDGMNTRPLIAMLTGRLEEISGVTIEREITGQHWSVRLTPVADNEWLMRRATRVELRGDPWMKSVFALTPHGDRIDIRFSDWRALGYEELTPVHERILYDD